MMNPQPFAAATRALVEARRSARLIDPVPAAWVPGDLAEAYRLQQAVAGGLGSTFGWKVTAITPAQQQTQKVAGPLAAPMLSPWLHDASATRATLRLADFVAPQLECEFAYVLGRDLPARPASAYTREEVRHAVEAMCIAVEIVDRRVPAGLGVHADLADAFNHGGFIAGPRVREWRSVDCAATAITLSADIDGSSAVLATGSGRAILDGDPFGAVVLLANAQAGMPHGLRAGDIVTTGSCTGAPRVPGPGRYSAVFEGVGRFEFSFV